MKCANCGFENMQDFSFCPSCGAPVCEVAPANDAVKKILQALKDPLFLVLCILVSVSCFFTLITSGPDVISILFTIFLWLTYAQARKDIADPKYLRYVSGTLYAHYVLINVAAIFTIVIGVLLAAFANTILDSTVVNALFAELEGELPAEAMAYIYPLLTSGLLTLVFVAFIAAGVGILLINLFSIRYIHRFAKSVYKSIEAGTLTLKHVNAARVWLYIFGIFSGLALLSSSDGITTYLLTAASCAASIIAAVLIQKHLLNQQV